MKRVFGLSVTLLLFLLGLGGSYEKPNYNALPAVQKVTFNNGRLGWSKLQIDQTKSLVDKVVGKKLKVEGAIGQFDQPSFGTEIAYQGEQVYLGFSGTADDSTLVEIHVLFPSDYRNSFKFKSLAPTLKKRVPGLILINEDYDSGSYKLSNSNVVILKDDGIWLDKYNIGE